MKVDRVAVTPIDQLDVLIKSGSARYQAIQTSLVARISRESSYLIAMVFQRDQTSAFAASGPIGENDVVVACIFFIPLFISRVFQQNLLCLPFNNSKRSSLATTYKEILENYTSINMRFSIASASAISSIMATFSSAFVMSWL